MQILQTAPIIHVDYMIREDCIFGIQELPLKTITTIIIREVNN